ncbi:MAG: TauD/TfdA family dioxygenase [Roseitalea sp.]|jgi:alpha-ketoglutarate-dependent taurine dioxygenase|nr:TauD/TfdA family dioxygenase [Roseitalea sp.]MBO6721000.1 TauD/TfdA family dioxygenase [Roseitalea sp.]MBO6742928.1 TauD/TfdA family dioxygenase [Roseitalea sp.]
MHLSQLKRRTRKRVDASMLANVSPPPDGRGPACVQAVDPSVNLGEWISANRPKVGRLLTEHGGVLFRGFAVGDMDAFRNAVKAASSRLIEYGERSSPRQSLGNNVYTSTEHPKHQPIVLHTEQSYTLNPPLKISFCCKTAAAAGGATPTSDMRGVIGYLAAHVPGALQRFRDVGVAYVRNYIPGISLSWQEAFQTDDRSQVEAHCRQADIAFEWRSDGVLRTRQIRSAVQTHPATGQEVWFNHGLFFNVESLEPEVAAALKASYADDELPYQTQYGDGQPIEPETIDALKAAYADQTTRFDWREGDVLILDNMLTAHGREPFEGERMVWTIMSDPIALPRFGPQGSAQPGTHGEIIDGVLCAPYALDGADTRLRMLRPAAGAFDLAAWIAHNRSTVNTLLLEHGALLFRGFDIPDAETFRDCAIGFSGHLLDYPERAAQRETIADQVFTSTAMASDQSIPLHHEMSYSHQWPSRLYFYCDRPAETGGETPLAWDRDVYPALPQDIRDAFEARHVLYVRNFGDDLDLPWSEVFQTEDRSEVEAYCTASGATFEWLSGNRLRTRQVRQAIARHPVTGEKVWFNHAALFHSSNMPADLREALLRQRGEDGLPRNAYFGDGSPIADNVVETIRATYRANSIAFPWQREDLLVVDNFLCTHGRNPFAGKRRTLVAMSDLFVSNPV